MKLTFISGPIPIYLNSKAFTIGKTASPASLDLRKALTSIAVVQRNIQDSAYGKPLQEMTVYFLTSGNQNDSHMNSYMNCVYDYFSVATDISCDST